MRASYAYPPIDVMRRDDFQGRLDYFYDGYVDFFPTGETGNHLSYNAA